MKIDILTLFPQMFTPLKESIVGRAEEKGLLTIDLHNIRDYTLDKHKKTDEYPFGGGAGMVMTCDPIFRTLNHVGTEGKTILYMSPKGRVLDQEKIEHLAAERELVILCGHYEGIDQRILDHFHMEEVSIGDYVLTGGEPAAVVLIDAVTRMIPEVILEESALEESIYSGLLEYPHYTKPREYMGMEVPAVLVSGNHKEINLWKFEQSLILTKERRPDLWEKFLKKADTLSKEEKIILEKVSGMM